MLAKEADRRPARLGVDRTRLYSKGERGKEGKSPAPPAIEKEKGCSVLFVFMFSELIRFYCHRACVSSNALAIGAVPPPAPVRPPATVLPSPDAAVAPGRSSEQVQQSPPLSYTGFGLNRTDY